MNKAIDNPYLREPCDRCGSKRYVAKTWKETTTNYSGMKVVIEYSQADCSNKECQKEFEKKLLVEEEKRKSLKQKKDADTLLRKENLAKSRKTKKGSN